MVCDAKKLEISEFIGFALDIFGVIKCVEEARRYQNLLFLSITLHNRTTTLFVYLTYIHMLLQVKYFTNA